MVNYIYYSYYYITILFLFTITWGLWQLRDPSGILFFLSWITGGLTVISSLTVTLMLSMFHAFLDMGLSENRIYIYTHQNPERNHYFIKMSIWRFRPFSDISIWLKFLCAHSSTFDLWAPCGCSSCHLAVVSKANIIGSKGCWLYGDYINGVPNIRDPVNCARACESQLASQAGIEVKLLLLGYLKHIKHLR